MTLLAKVSHSFGVAMLAFVSLFGQSDVNQSAAPQVRQTILTVTVTDRQHHLLDGLETTNFKVYENDQLQPIQTVSHGDTPVCMGLVVDISGSMRPKHAAVVTALMEMLRARGGKDSVFVVNFNDQPYLDTDFTNDLEKVESGLNRGVPRGGTALYDALTASAIHLADARACRKRVLVAVTDGDDNSSRYNLQKTLDVLVYENGPVIYAISIPDRGVGSRMGQDRKALEALTGVTGGAPFFAGSLRDINRAVSRLLEELGKQYTIVYASTDSAGEKVRKIRVEAAAPGQDLVIRAKAEIKPGK
jgi:Ca-activated chloride channel homolog